MLIRYKITTIFIIVLFLGLSLSGIINKASRDVQSTIQTLSGQHLPRLRLLNQIREGFLEEERTLHNYYTSKDWNSQTKRIKSNRQIINNLLNKLKDEFPDDEKVKVLRQLHQRINHLSWKLDALLSTEPISEAPAQRLLIGITESGKATSSLLRQFNLQIENDLILDGRGLHEEINTINWVAALCCVVIFSLMLLLVYYINIMIKNSAELRRLKTFPERNPNPVISVNRHGEIEYTNSAFKTLHSELSPDDESGLSLLPDNYLEQFKSIEKNPQNTGVITHEFAAHIFEYQVCPLVDLGEYHIYLLDVTERQHALERVKYQAIFDTLTQLPNRTYFEQETTRQLEAAGDKQIAVVLLRVDKFARIVSTYGRDIGDRLIVQIGERIDKLLVLHNFESKYKLFRFDDMTFAVLLHEIKNFQQAETLGTIMIMEMEKAFILNENEHYLRAFVGMTFAPLHGSRVMDLIRNADAAIAHAMQDENSDVAIYNVEMHEEEEKWLDIERGLKLALENNELYLVYQPQFDLDNNGISGIEALLRWKKTDGTMISPGEFIPIAEQSGLILNIGEWVFNETCRQTREWVDEGLIKDMTISVNISARQFQTTGFLEMVGETLEKYELPPKYIGMELTESLLMYDINQSIEIMKALKSMGITLSIDDFGTGYSSLNYLKQFPIDKLKIDQSFIRNVTTNEDDAAIVHSIISLAHNLNLKVVTEGVETEEQMAMVIYYGSGEIQGYYYSRPLEKEAIYEFLMKTNEYLTVCE